MRVFIALDLPQSATEMLETLQNRLMDLAAGGRKVPSNNMHLTLRFFEDLSDAQVDLVADSCEAVSLAAPAPLLTVAGLGGFVRSGGDTVYARIGGDVDAVLQMEQLLTAELSARGIKPDPRPFYPHITLMRGANYRTASQLNIKSEIFFGTNLTMYRSMLQDGLAPTYDPLLTLPLMR